MSDLIIFEAGMRIGGAYSKFMESPDREKVEEHAEIMRAAVSSEDIEIVILEKTYRLINTTPYIIYPPQEQKPCKKS
jgi:hypothetical protein